MKKFSFNLENLLQHRKNLEEREKTALSRIQYNLQNEQNRRDQILARNLEALAELEALRRSNSTQDELRLYYPYLDRLKHEADKSAQNIVRLEKELQEQKSVVLVASRNKKVIETLKSRKKAEHMLEADRQEQKFIDEVVVSRMGRNQE
jgi:flagellar protein FliJ